MNRLPEWQTLAVKFLIDPTKDGSTSEELLWKQ